MIAITDIEYLMKEKESLQKIQKQLDRLEAIVKCRYVDRNSSNLIYPFMIKYLSEIYTISLSHDFILNASEMFYSEINSPLKLSISEIYDVLQKLPEFTVNSLFSVLDCELYEKDELMKSLKNNDKDSFCSTIQNYRIRLTNIHDYCYVLLLAEKIDTFFTLDEIEKHKKQLEIYLESVNELYIQKFFDYVRGRYQFFLIPLLLIINNSILFGYNKSDIERFSNIFPEFFGVMLCCEAFEEKDIIKIYLTRIMEIASTNLQCMKSMMLFFVRLKGTDNSEFNKFLQEIEKIENGNKNSHLLIKCTFSSSGPSANCDMDDERGYSEESGNVIESLNFDASIEEEIDTNTAQKVDLPTTLFEDDTYLVVDQSEFSHNSLKDYVCSKETNPDPVGKLGLLIDFFVKNNYILYEDVPMFVYALCGRNLNPGNELKRIDVHEEKNINALSVVASMLCTPSRIYKNFESCINNNTKKQMKSQDGRHSTKIRNKIKEIYKFHFGKSGK